MVRAKFRCLEVTTRFSYHAPDGAAVTQTSVRLVPTIYNKKGAANADDENKAFWDATPNGELTMVITNPAAKDYFKVGTAYYLDFSEAEG